MTLLMRLLFASVGLILILSLMPMMPPAQAADPPITIHVPGDYPTIQAAIDAATDADTVLVADGTYTGEGNKNLDFEGKAITVQSEHGPEDCIIDCGGDGRGFYFHSGEGEYSVVSGLTVRNGYVHRNSSEHYGGGGIYCESSSPTITNCNLAENEALNGGGVACWDSSPTITNCIISGNVASNYGGGISCRESSSPVITDCTIYSNTGDNCGGGVACFAISTTPLPTPVVIITGCVIDNNTGGDTGGGIWTNNFASATITDCTLSNNTAAHGGGISCVTTPIDITSCTINGNTATNGGGIAVESPSTITNCIISDNAASNAGAGIYCGSSSATITNCTISGNTGDGIYCGDWPSPTISNCIISSNSGSGIRCGGSSPTIMDCIISGNTSDAGGGISCRYASPTIASCTISGNTADTYGGGFYYWGIRGDSSPRITNSLIVGNTAHIHGGGLYCEHGASLVITSCTISGNSDAVNGGAIYCRESSPTVTNCIISRNTGGIATWGLSYPTASYSNIEGGYIGEGNIFGDPLFVRAGDYHLQVGSPCIDTGTNNASELADTDFEGDPRILDGNNDGTATVDMGADEFNTPVAEGQEIVTDEDYPVDITLTAWHPGQDPLVFSVVSQPAHGTLSGSAPNVTYTPHSDYNGPDSFTFMANDGSLNSNVATVAITVTPVDEPVEDEDEEEYIDEDQADDDDAITQGDDEAESQDETDEGQEDEDEEAGPGEADSDGGLPLWAWVLIGVAVAVVPVAVAFVLKRTRSAA